ncbi:hypothetical protein E2C01_082094 [Portunus trituberculatus]|uniref:Uncharacterized protein n=1 Tax=Portunus trituberculatus TaxID=210409 RepID=A0A5B7J0M7_PORTR|nr:hypothetical protein [Portunus trituberculatus]
MARRYSYSQGTGGCSNPSGSLRRFVGAPVQRELSGTRQAGKGMVGVQCPRAGHVVLVSTSLVDFGGLY